jgi:FkbM family methyltransferase
MDLYGQDAEVRMLRRLLSRLDRRTMIDVGAERGGMAEQMLQAGVETLYAFDPHPDNATALRVRFADDPRVTVYEHALSDADGSGELHVSSDSNGEPLPFGHTLLERNDTDEIGWRKTLTVDLRSLQSLIDGRDIPAKIGILKIDTEGHDLAVVQGMGALEADVVMVEHWTELPKGLGTCPWNAEEMIAALRARGFTHFAFIVHRGEFVTLKWDDADVERGVMGNLVFVHERVLARLLPELLDDASGLAEEAVRIGRAYMRVAEERLGLVDELKQAADDRLALVNEVTLVAEERLEALLLTRSELEATSAELNSLRSSLDRSQSGASG